MARQDERDLEEHWRLLYVGLTRAEERLVIAGLQTKANGGVRPEKSWHPPVEGALVSLGAQPNEDASWGEVLRYRGPVSGGAVKPKPPSTALPGPLVPAWAKKT